MTTTPPTAWSTYTILTGVVGSRAHGLNTATSDVDRCSVFAYNTVDMAALYPPHEQTLTADDSDHTFHEVGKFCRLALACNPHALELLWLPSYERLAPLGHDLVAMRAAFLAAPLVRSAYLGYARSQLKRLGRPNVAKLPNEKRAKLARHFARILTTGQQLYTTGELYVSAAMTPVDVIQFGVKFASDHDAGVAQAQAMIDAADAAMNAPSPLPDQPDALAVTAYVARVRSRYLVRNTAPNEADWVDVDAPDARGTVGTDAPEIFQTLRDEMGGYRI